MNKTVWRTIMETKIERFIKLCLELDDADNARNIRKYNRTIDSLSKVDKYLNENEEEAMALIELMKHDNITVRGNAAAYCYNRNMMPDLALAVMNEVFENAPIGNLRAGIGIKLGIISGRLAHLVPKKRYRLRART